MIAKMAADRGISLVKTSAFNYDGEEHAEISVEEARGIFDYEVLVKPCRDEHGDALSINYLVNSRGNTIIPSYGVGERFTPIDNKGWFDFFVNNVMPELPGLKLETAATLYGGGTALLTTTFGDDWAVKGDNSPMRSRILFANDNTGQAAMLNGLTTVRVVCMNTLAMACGQVRGQSGTRVRHTATAEERAKEIVTEIKNRLVVFANTKSRIQNLASRQITPAMVGRVLDAIDPVPQEDGPAKTRSLARRANIVWQLEEGETAQTFTEKNGWTLFNALTHDIFNAKKPRRNTDRADVAFNASLGAKGGVIAKWFDIVESAVFAAA